MAANEALRFSCVASFEATHFFILKQEVNTEMKKWTALVLALVICLSLCACAGGKSETPAEESDNDETSQAVSCWELDYAVDDFGDPFDTKFICSAPFSGDFSNIATNSSPLLAVVQMIPYFVDSEYYDRETHSISNNALSFFSFQLLEYENTYAAYLSSDEITLKFKIGDDSKTYTRKLSGQAPNGNVFCELKFSSDTSDVMNDFRAALFRGETIKCIIYIANSQYNFVVDGTGFLDAYNALAEEYGHPTITINPS